MNKCMKAKMKIITFPVRRLSLLWIETFAFFIKKMFLQKNKKDIYRKMPFLFCEIYKQTQMFTHRGCLKIFLLFSIPYTTPQNLKYFFYFFSGLYSHILCKFAEEWYS